MNGFELKKLRTEAGMTQAELAEGLGYFSKGKPNRSIVARWENNHQAINSRIEKAIIVTINEKREVGNVSSIRQ